MLTAQGGCTHYITKGVYWATAERDSHERKGLLNASTVWTTRIPKISQKTSDAGAMNSWIVVGCAFARSAIIYCTCSAATSAGSAGNVSAIHV